MDNMIRQALEQGKPSVGTWLNLGSPLVAETLAVAGFSWLCIDAEHTAYDLGEIAHCCVRSKPEALFPWCERGTTNRPPSAACSTRGPGALCFPM